MTVDVLAPDVIDVTATSGTTFELAISTPAAIALSANLGEPKIIVLYGTGSPPSATGLADGTLFFKYV
jgi:hypothetical protein